MQSILVCVDGSDHALNAVRYAIKNMAQNLASEIHLLNVQPEITFVGLLPDYDEAVIHKTQHEQAEKKLSAASTLLDEAGLPYTKHIAIGNVPHQIVNHARDHRCDAIFMGVRGLDALDNFVLGSTANKVLLLSEKPVTLIK